MSRYNMIFGLSAAAIVGGLVMTLMPAVMTPLGALSALLLGGGAIVLLLLRMLTPRAVNFRVRRLRGMQYLSAVLLIFAAYCLRRGDSTWLVLVICATVFELYAAFRMPQSED